MDYSQRQELFNNLLPDLLGPLLLLVFLCFVARVDVIITFGSTKYRQFSWLLGCFKLKKEAKKEEEDDSVIAPKMNGKGAATEEVIVKSNGTTGTKELSMDHETSTSDRRIVQLQSHPSPISQSQNQNHNITTKEEDDTVLAPKMNSEGAAAEVIVKTNGIRRNKEHETSTSDKRFVQLQSLPSPISQRQNQSQNHNATKRKSKRSSWVQPPSPPLRTPPNSRRSKLLSFKQSKHQSKSTCMLVSPNKKRSPSSRRRSFQAENLYLGDSFRTLTTFQSSNTFQSVEESSSQHSEDPHMNMMTLLDKYSFMSYRFPVTTETEKIFFRKQPNNNKDKDKQNKNPKNKHNRDVLIETSGGNCIGSIDYSAAKERGVRILKDATGRHCAIIHKTRDDNFLGGPIVFRVYGDKPSVFGQEPISVKEVVKGCYLWAEIKNKGSILGGKFVMKRYTSETSSFSEDRHYAKPFGSFLSKSKGYTIMDSNEKQCVKMVSLEKNRNKGIVIAPNRDMCLMLAFCAVVDEMVENLLV